jgi:hypothetical protein
MIIVVSAQTSEMDLFNSTVMNKKDLTERDICTKFNTPAAKQAGWDEISCSPLS